MFDRNDLDLRYRNHYERASVANATQQPRISETSQLHNLRRHLAALLLALAFRLAPEPAAPAAEPTHEPAA
ncbi:MAG TPA: hypothetical protein VFI42_04965 [Thermomicrobiaceae bacterium]|nr:hypothetical protein [Thermomicrobiaceae bacterium]